MGEGKTLVFSSRKRVGDYRVRIVDYIRHMPDEVLAQFLLDIAYENCPNIHLCDGLNIPSPFGGYLVQGVIDVNDTDVVLEKLIEEEPGEDD